MAAILHFTYMRYKHSQYHSMRPSTHGPTNKFLNFTMTSSKTHQITYAIHLYSIHIIQPINHFTKSVYKIFGPERDTLLLLLVQLQAVSMGRQLLQFTERYRKLQMANIHSSMSV